MQCMTNMVGLGCPLSLSRCPTVLGPPYTLNPFDRCRASTHSSPLSHPHEAKARAIGHRFDIRMRNRIELVIAELAVRLHPHISRLVARSVAVIRTRECGDAQTVMLNRIALGTDLVRPNDSGDIVELAPSACNVRPKADANTLVCQHERL